MEEDSAKMLHQVIYIVVHAVAGMYVYAHQHYTDFRWCQISFQGSNSLAHSTHTLVDFNRAVMVEMLCLNVQQAVS
jgi:hypothetical protein